MDILGILVKRTSGYVLVAGALIGTKNGRKGKRMVDEKLQEYERQKKEIAEQRLSPDQYEAEMKKLVRKLRV